MKARTGTTTSSIRQLAAAAFVAASSIFALACTPAPVDGTATVVEVVDGDTIRVRLAGRVEIVRLIGIDTPETVHPNKPVECFGPEASALASSLMPRGTKVRLTRDVEARDHFGRLLAYVTRVVDGVHVNHEMITRGMAVPLSIAPNTAHERAFAEAAHLASKARLGLWGACDR